MRHLSKPKLQMYLTPLFAQAAYEQILAWYRDPSTSADPSRTQNPPTYGPLDTDQLIKPDIRRLKCALSEAGVKIELLEQNGCAAELNDTTEDGTGNKINHYRFYMHKLHDIAYPNNSVGKRPPEA